MVERVQKKIETLKNMIDMYEKQSSLTDKEEDMMVHLLDKAGQQLIPSCPFGLYDKGFFIDSDGSIYLFENGHVRNDYPRPPRYEDAYAHGNLFHTKEEAMCERDRRELLTRFRAFRDKCNGDWKPNWTDKHEEKLFIVAQPDNLVVHSTWFINQFPTFGFFKHKSDAELAIALFGDEIKRLYVEVE